MSARSAGPPGGGRGLRSSRVEERRCLMCRCRSWWSRRTAASAAATSTPACSRTGSSSSARAIDDDVANVIIAQLLFLESEDPDKDIIHLHQQPGRLGHGGPRHLRHHAVREARRLHHLHGPGGLDGRRSCWRPAPRASASRLPNARIMIHQRSGGFQGQATDIEIHAREILRLTQTPQRASWPATPASRSSGSSKRHRARLLHGPGRGQGVRPHRRGHRTPAPPPRHRQRKKQG